jgi:hexosaminidase
LSCTEEKIKVAEGYGIFPNIACAGKDKTYEFCYDVLDEIAQLFPYEYIHLGGDEALKLYWIDCPHCQKAIKDNGLKNEEELQGYFMTKMVKYLNQKGKKVINWNDGMLGDNIEGDITVHYWRQTKECNEVVRKEAKKNRGIIISPFFSYYLDYPHGMTPLKKTYNYQIDSDIEENVIGLEAPLWTEHVLDVNRLEYMTYPRLLAVAERAWTQNADYTGFLQRLSMFGKIFDKHAINYCKDYNPNIIKGKLDVAKFFLNALGKVGKGNLKARKLTNKKLKNKYKN